MQGSVLSIVNFLGSRADRSSKVYNTKNRPLNPLAKKSPSNISPPEMSPDDPVVGRWSAILPILFSNAAPHFARHQRILGRQHAPNTSRLPKCPRATVV